jgi:chromosome segregation ATPase
MGDPGGAIGALSLALQVVQSLKVYYSQFTAYHEDIQSIVLRTTRLENLLLVLERPIRKLDLDDDPISRECRKCISECMKAVEKLTLYQERVSQTNNTEDRLRKRVRGFQKRLAYPFRKDALEDLQTVLDRLLENLQLVIQALQL